MRVVHFHRRPGPGRHSVERVFADVRAAMPAGFACEVATCRFPSSGALGRAYDSLAAARKQGDVNHVTGDVHYLTYFLHRRRTVLTILDCVSLHRLNGWRRALFRLLWYDLPMRRAAVVTAISQSTKGELVRWLGVDPNHVQVIPCCVSAMYKAKLRPVRPKRPVILQVGTSANKNVLRLARALCGMDCELRIVGEPRPDQVRALNEGRVSFSSVSSVTDAQMIAEYENCDLVSFVSLYEGFGLPIVEANSVGRPVVTSACSSMPEVAGQAACFVDPTNIQSIRGGIQKVLEDHDYRGQLVEAGLVNAKRFAPNAVARAFSEVYEALGAGGATAPPRGA
jgi:glycosyltransferase involved in cell wall biosynthesis